MTTKFVNIDEITSYTDEEFTPAIQIVGTDGINTKPILLDSNGRILVSVTTPLSPGSNIIGKVKLTGDDENSSLGVTEDGRLKAELSPPTTPSSKTGVVGEDLGTISSPTYRNYDIPIGETLVLQHFLAGCEGERGKGSKIEIFYDQAVGEPIQDQRLSLVYVNSSSIFVPLNFTTPRPAISGDRIRILRTPLEGSSQEIYAKWEGYY